MKKIIGLNLLLTFFLSIFYFGCHQSNPVNQILQQSDYEIKVWNYSDNYYFLDTNYKSNFIDFESDGVLNSSENISRRVSTENFEVWILTNSTTADRRMVSAIIDLPPLPGSAGYDTSYYAPRIIPGKRYFGLFRKLSPSEYIVNYSAGFIGLKNNISDNDFIAVSYREVGTGKTYGTNSLTFNNDTLVLKMIKTGNVSPQSDTLAWAMKMKNVYKLPSSNITEIGFELKIAFIDPANPIQSPTLPDGKSVLNVTGLDRYIGHGPAIGPDNNFDFITDRTIITETGDIIFPTTQPFYDEILKETTNSNLPYGDTTLIVKSIYTKLKSEAAVSQNNSMYIIKGKLLNQQ
ncbi:MAG: hypothetical protein JSS63_06420 [Bacteroidetes bacterium]|nr:hypothetical protein [Bacteroidota bacterium]